MKKQYSKAWLKSTQVRKQRKFRYTAPLHMRGRMLHVHLSPELRKKYGLRNIQVRKGDTVKLMRGQFAPKQGKVEKVLLKRQRIFVHGIDIIKKDGSKVLFPLPHTHLMITELELSDKRRLPQRTP